MLLQQVWSRVEQLGWDSSILTINHGNKQYNIIEHFGLIPAAAYTAHVQSYAFTNSRDMQDATNLYYTLHKSISNKAQQELLADQDSYVVIPPTNQPGLKKYCDSILFLKLIIYKLTVTTNTSIAVLLAKIMRLDELMVESNLDISTFNMHVYGILQDYTANSSTAVDKQLLYQQLIKAYKQCENHKCMDFVKHIDMLHTCGKVNLTSLQLME